MNLKRKVYAEVDSFAENRTLFASNTSTLPITEMAELTSRPRPLYRPSLFQPTTADALGRSDTGRENEPQYD